MAAEHAVAHALVPVRRHPVRGCRALDENEPRREQSARQTAVAAFRTFAIPPFGTAANVSVCAPVASNQANVHFGWLATTLADAEGLFNEGVFEAKPGRFL